MGDGQVSGEDGQLITPNGEIATIRLFQRGAHLDFSIGKYFKLSTKC